jgi:hypothetical protein
MRALDAVKKIDSVVRRLPIPQVLMGRSAVVSFSKLRASYRARSCRRTGELALLNEAAVDGKTQPAADEAIRGKAFLSLEN